MIGRTKPRFDLRSRVEYALLFPVCVKGCHEVIEPGWRPRVVPKSRARANA